MPKRNLNLNIWIILSILLVVGGYLVSRNISYPTKLGQTQGPAVTAIAKETTWKTYTSPKAKYSFQYPEDWPFINEPTYPGSDTIESQVFASQLVPNNSDATIAELAVFKEDNLQSTQDYINTYLKNDPSIHDIREETLGGVNFVSYVPTEGTLPLAIREYVGIKDGLFYKIRLEDSIETNKNRERNIVLFNQMLKSFKFN